MTLSLVIILLATGIGVGFAGGLLGVGGCFIMTPVLYMVFTDMGIPPDIAIRMSFGTCLLVALPTAISGAWKHSQNGAVRWRAAVVMGCCSSVAAFLGATLGTLIPGTTLKIVFGAVVLLGSVRMLTIRPSSIDLPPVTHPWLMAAWAIPIGLMGGLIGIGGGVLAIPIMVLALRFKMHHAVGTSLAMMIFTSAGGVIGYIVNGLGVPGLPAYCLGYINLPAWLLLAVSSAGMAQVGAMVAQRSPARYLRYIFVAVMLYMGLKMLGLFDWLGWPI